MNLANFAYENGFDGMVLNNHPENQEKYHAVFKPEINKFTKKYGKTPNAILNDFFKSYIISRKLDSDFTSKGFNFVGMKLHTYVWACLYSKDAEGLKQNNPPVTQLPQIYFTISNAGIHFGFAYGNLVKENAIQVQKVKEKPELLNEIGEYLQRDNELIIAGDILSNDGKTYERVNFETIGDLIPNWSNSIWIGKEYPKNEIDNKIDDNIEEKLTETFDNLLDVFKFTSLPNPPPQNPRKYWQISLREDATMWDEWKKNNIVAIGFQEVIEPVGAKILEISDDEIKKLYRDTHPENPNPDEESDKIINFLLKMEVDEDCVITDQEGLGLGWGIIKSGPKYGYSQEFPVYRQIEWKNTDIQKPVPEDREM